MENNNYKSPINLQKLLTPAMDSSELIQTKNKKMYASSCFYAPTHPTVEDQVELARRISYSLSDVKNMKSKGQSMYVNRKKRSVKWIHDGNGTEEEAEVQQPVHKDKVPLKCMMNPNGKVMDIHCVQALGEELNIGTSPLNAEKLFDIVRDLNNQKGRGAEIFAKRRKRSEKWVVDKEELSPSNSSINQNYPATPNYPTKMEFNNSNGVSKLGSVGPLSPMNISNQKNGKPFYNPFDSPAVSSEMHSNRNHYPLYENGLQKPEPKIRKIYLKEVAVGTDPEYPMNGHKKNGHVVEKSRRMSFDSDYSSSQINMNGRSKSNKSSRISENHKLKNCDGSYGHSKPYKSHHHHHHHQNHQQNHHYHHQNQSPAEMNEEEIDYTPIPVKQLIQEFEKTCRPVLQYKQMATKAPAVAQNPPIDDISRFFESPRAPAKPNGIQNGLKHQMNGNPMKYANGVVNGNGHFIQPKYHPQHNMIPIPYEYESTDDDSDESLDESSISYNDDYCDEISSSRYSNDVRMPLTSGNRVPSSVSQYDFDNSNQIIEAPDEFQDEIDGSFVDTDAEISSHTKSLLLSNIATQEELVNQIKQLRKTPVLETLVADAALIDSNKLYESTYSGPVINNVQHLTNYNTAPRGWDQSQSFYRPVTFKKENERQSDPILYSDF